jgi:hypothetical protein
MPRAHRVFVTVICEIVPAIMVLWILRRKLEPQK